MNLLIMYIVVGLSLSYILRHQLTILKLIPTKNDLKMRKKVSQKQEQLTLYIKLCPVWPLLLLKEVYDEIQERRQS